MKANLLLIDGDLEGRLPDIESCALGSTASRAQQVEHANLPSLLRFAVYFCNWSITA